jgi:5,6-dimethylbenzimidazole synthase
MTLHAYSLADRDAIYRVIKERRDMRHFNSDPVDPAILKRLLMAAHQAPSVGLMQPWRIIRITDLALRQSIKMQVNEENNITATALGERQQEFLQLKVDGIDQCAEVLVMSLMNEREQHVFGRRTMPEMDLASVACSIQNMWLAARAEGLGMGWVSLFNPHDLAKLLNMPEGSKPVAILCLGHVDEFYSAPMLEQENWRQGCDISDVLYENTWGNN